MKFVRVSNEIHASAYSFFLKKWRKNFKEKLRTLRSFTQYNPHKKNNITANTINSKNFLPNLYYIESEAFSEDNYGSAMELLRK